MASMGDMQDVAWDKIRYALAINPLARLFSAIKINPFPFRIDQILHAMLIVSQNSTSMIIIQF